MALNRAAVALLLLLGTAAQANEADDNIRRLAAKAREYAAARRSEEVVKTLFEIAEALPGASEDGIAALNELSRYLAVPAATTPRQDATPPVISEPAATPPQPIESLPAQLSAPPGSEATVTTQQRPPAPAPPASAPSAAAMVPQASPALLELLRRQGAAALGSGDISGARRFYQRGAEAGCAPCAEAMAQTFDAEQLSRMGVIGIRPDPAQAEAWRARARQLTRIGTP